MKVYIEIQWNEYLELPTQVLPYLDEARFVTGDVNKGTLEPRLEKVVSIHLANTLLSKATETPELLVAKNARLEKELDDTINAKLVVEKALAVEKAMRKWGQDAYARGVHSEELRAKLEAKSAWVLKEMKDISDVL